MANCQNRFNSYKVNESVVTVFDDIIVGLVQMNDCEIRRRKQFTTLLSALLLNKGRNPSHPFHVRKSVTSWQLPRLRASSAASTRIQSWGWSAEMCGVWDRGMVCLSTVI